MKPDATGADDLDPAVSQQFPQSAYDPNVSSGLEIMAYRLDIQAGAQSLAGMDEAELRRRAVEAARDMDEVVLWELLQGNLILNGLSGARVSNHTLRV